MDFDLLPGFIGIIAILAGWIVPHVGDFLYGDDLSDEIKYGMRLGFWLLGLMCFVYGLIHWMAQ